MGEEEKNKKNNDKGKGSGGGRSGKKPERVAMYKLFHFADRVDVWLMAVGTVSAIGNGLAQPLMTLVFGQLINSFGSSDPSQVVHTVSKVAVKMVYLAIGAGIASFLQVSTWMVTGERQAARIRGLYLKTILRQDVGFFDTETTTGEVIGRMSGDTVLIQDAMGEKVGKFLQLVSTFVGGFVVALTRGWRLTLVLLSCIPLLVFAAGTMIMINSKMSSRGQVAYAEAGNVVEQTVGSIRTVAAFTGEKHAILKYKSKLEIAFRATVRQGAASGTGLGCVLLILFCCYGLAIWYGSKLIIENGYDGGKVITVIFTVMAGGMSLGQTAPCLNAFAAGQAAAFKMFETIKRVPTIDPYDETGIILDQLEGDVELKDVHFRYPARPDMQIFSGFSLKVPSGTTAALVGQSGSGKSTVISLVERFYDPDSGEVLIDGVNLKDFNLNWIRKQIGLVGQEPILFATSIKENIAYGKENATDQEIRTAIELANAAKFIDKLPQGVETMVGEHGTQLSGGQKQRIAIARAILKNPKILLLDEATSALDAESERIVQDALANVMSNRTTVVVAHRLTTIRSADLIAVVQGGAIVEKGESDMLLVMASVVRAVQVCAQSLTIRASNVFISGTHDELTKNPDGAYSQLVRLQEVANKPEASQGRNVETSETKPDSQKLSSLTSRSKGGSSGRRPSFSLGTASFGVPGSVRFEEGEEGGEQIGAAEVKEKPTGVSIRRLAYLNKPELPVLLAGSMAAIVHGVIFPVFGLLLSSAISMFYKPPEKLRKDSRIWAVIFVCLGVVNVIVLPLQNYFFGVAGGRLIERIRAITFERVVHQDISWFDDSANSSGAVGARLSTDASNIRSLVGDTLALIVQNISTIVAALIISFSANWILALIIIGVSPLMLIQGSFQSRFTKGFSADAKVMYEEASQVANDAVGSIRTVASFCAEKKVMEMYQSKCDGPVKNGVKLGLVSGSGLGVSFFVLYCTNAFIFYIGSILVKHGKTDFGDVFKVFFAITIAGIGVSQSSSFAQDKAKAQDSVASIFAIIDRRPKIDSGNEDGVTLANVKGETRLEHIDFKYPTRPDIQIFKDLSLTIPSGKAVALVGESGSGKSTVISLIERFYDPDAGCVYLDNVDIRKCRLSWLRQQMGLVSQEPALFNDSIRANIAYGKTGDVTEQDIIAATKAANAHNFISSLPQGYDTNVGERGVQLSGGQKQRIAIARAILKDPRILLLDEATSALDAESERVVQDALDKVMVNRTSVIVAHRLTTIRGADIIAVVKNGVIAEKGSHDMLMKINNGAYASLVALQTSH